MTTTGKFERLVLGTGTAGTDNGDGSLTVTAPDTATHIADTVDAHDASAISIADAGNYFAATEVEAALQALAAGTVGSTPGVTQLATQTLAVAAANIDFTSISGAFNHLQVVLISRCSTSATNEVVYARFNNDSGANYDWMVLRGPSVTQSSAADTNGLYLGDSPAATGPAGAASLTYIDIPYYASTTFHKTAHTRNLLKNGTATSNFFVYENGGWWRSTAAITRITIRPAANNFIAGTQATLYGIT